MLPLAHFLPEFDTDDGTPFENLAPLERSRKPAFEHPILVASREFPAAAAAPVISSPIPEMTELDEADELNGMVQPDGEMPDLTGEGDWPAADIPNPIDLSDDEESLPDEDLDIGAALDAGADLDLEIDADTANGETLDDGAVADSAAMEEAIEAARAEEREKAEAAQSAAIEAARAEWTAAEGERLASLLSDRLDRIETVVRTSLGSVLRPIAVNTRRRQSILELADATRMLIGDGKALSVRATGPSDLLDALGDALGTRSDFVTWQGDDGMVDVRIECDQTVVETRLQGWRAALEEALA